MHYLYVFADRLLSDPSGRNNTWLQCTNHSLSKLFVCCRWSVTERSTIHEHKRLVLASKHYLSVVDDRWSSDPWRQPYTNTNDQSQPQNITCMVPMIEGCTSPEAIMKTNVLISASKHSLYVVVDGRLIEPSGKYEHTTSLLACCRQIHVIDDRIFSRLIVHVCLNALVTSPQHALLNCMRQN